jgi:small ligand-binding sensory domain FIST
MKSVVLQLQRDDVAPAAPSSLASRASAEAEAQGLDPGRPPAFVLAFLPPGDRLAADLDTLAAAFPESLRFGCEAVTQFAGSRTTGAGVVQLFWLEGPTHGVQVTALRSLRGAGFDPDELGAAVSALERADAAFLLCDGLRFPAWELLEELRSRLPEDAPPVVGGLASQVEPISDPGARVFLGTEVFEAACLLVAFRGVEMDVEVVRGWDAASPIFTVTEAAGDVVREIDGEPAPEWFRRFFTVDGELAPMPESAHRFPLILEGPRPERRGVYRSMKAFDQPPGAVTFWGDIQTGDRVRLGMGNDASLLRTAGELFAGRDPEAAVLFSCVGREAVLGDLAEREVATIRSALGGVALAGFFTFGEIGPPMVGSGCAFYNQTAILALLRERRP